jgi:hypothetical protein
VVTYRVTGRVVLAALDGVIRVHGEKLVGLGEQVLSLSGHCRRKRGDVSYGDGR